MISKQCFHDIQHTLKHTFIIQDHCTERSNTYKKTKRGDNERKIKIGGREY